MRASLHRKSGLVALVVGVGLAAGGIAYASIPDSSGIIHGCYAKSGGSLRVVDDSTATCKSNENPLQWSGTTPENWHEVGDPGEPTIQGDWVVPPPGLAHPGTTVGFYKDPLGVVHLKGNLLGGGIGRADPMFFLPVGYRPVSFGVCLSTYRDGAAIVCIDAEDGRVFQNGGVTTNPLGLDGLSFRVNEG